MYLLIAVFHSNFHSTPKAPASIAAHRDSVLFKCTLVLSIFSSRFLFSIKSILVPLNVFLLFCPILPCTPLAMFCLSILVRLYLVCLPRQPFCCPLYRALSNR